MREYQLKSVESCRCHVGHSLMLIGLELLLLCLPREICIPEQRHSLHGEQAIVERHDIEIEQLHGRPYLHLFRSVDKVKNDAL